MEDPYPRTQTGSGNSGKKQQKDRGEANVKGLEVTYRGENQTQMNHCSIYLALIQ